MSDKEALKAIDKVLKTEPELAGSWLLKIGKRRRLAKEIYEALIDPDAEAPLLTPEERKPYFAMEKCQITDNLAGVYDTEYEVWNISKLLEAQRDKSRNDGFRKVK